MRGAVLVGSELARGPEKCGRFSLPTFHHGCGGIGQRGRWGREVAANLELHCQKEQMVIMKSLVFGPGLEFYALRSGINLSSMRSVRFCKWPHDYTSVHPFMPFWLYSQHSIGDIDDQLGGHFVLHTMWDLEMNKVVPSVDNVGLKCHMCTGWSNHGDDCDQSYGHDNVPLKSLYLHVLC